MAPTPVPVGFPRAAWAVATYEGSVRSALVAYKDDGRRDLAKVLAPLLATSIEAAVAGLGADLTCSRPGARASHTCRVVVVPVPSSPAAVRARGDAPLLALSRSALRWSQCGDAPVLFAPRALSVRRGVRDQSGLSSRERAANLVGAFRASTPMSGCRVVLVDDVVTTGATLAEAAVVLRDAGAADVVAACLAATRRRASPTDDGGPAISHR